MSTRFFLATILLALLLPGTTAIASEATLPISVVDEAPYWTDPAAAAEADGRFDRAMAMSDSGFEVGSPLEMNRLLDQAAMAGHPGAAALLCVFNSHELGGTLFYGKAYVWCQVAEYAFADRAPDVAADARRRLDYAISRLGDDLGMAEENEQYVLKRMTGRPLHP
jgi:hypothetical protein